jgi:D-alanyl-lipoteichoic acid acyltransferase DltB (MBOAT superfamily)
MLEEGIWLMLWGMFKKVVLADNFAPLADMVFSNTTFNAPAVILGTLAFGLQIYCDFSGYSDIARGTARVLGFDIMWNFSLPYTATSPREFWRRWHISLSTWLRDYLYIPLGGNRRGEVRAYRNLIITMALGGLWHGARWTMVVWGLYHGIGLVLHRLFLRASGRVRQPASTVGPTRDRWLVPKIVMMFQFTCLGWLLFRADSLGQVAGMLASMATNFHTTAWSLPAIATLTQLTILLMAYELGQYLRGDLLLVFRWRPIEQLAFTLLVTYSAALYWMLHRSLVAGSQPFIYFQF